MNEEVFARLRTWAASNPAISRMWVFGSRVKGTARPDSDLDIAIEVRAIDTDPTPYTTFTFEREAWAAELQKLSPWPVQLCNYDETCPPDAKIGNVVKAISDGNILIHDAQQAVPADGPASRARG